MTPRMTTGRRSFLALTIVVAAGCAGLAGWQLNRLFDRRARNHTALAQQHLPPVDLNRSRLEGSVQYRRASATGEYLGPDLLIRGRLLRGTPGIHVVTPFRVAGRDTVVLVHRGFVPTPDAGAPPTTDYFQEPGPVTIDGIALTVPDEGDGQPLATQLGETWRRLDLTALRTRLPFPIASYYLIAGVDSTATTAHTMKGRELPIRIEPPSLDDGPHLSYAIQWLMIGGAALGFGLVFVRRGEERSSIVP